MKRERHNPKASPSAAVSVRRREQRGRLLQAAQRAIHRSGPRVSMDEIAAEAGITKPIFYRHFGDRRGLACALRDCAFGFTLGGLQDDLSAAPGAARQRIAAFYPVVSDADHLRRVVVGWAMGFRMFVETNRNLYRFLRREGVLDSMWEELDGQPQEPVAESLAGSLRAVFAERGIDDATAQIWAHALRGTVREIVDWSSEVRTLDRFELESQLELVTRALIDGLGRSLRKSRKVERPRRPVKRGRGRKSSTAAS